MWHDGKEHLSFDPELNRVLGDIFDRACALLGEHANGCAREVLAMRIIELARRGERDPAFLERGAIDYLRRRFLCAA